MALMQRCRSLKIAIALLALAGTAQPTVIFIAWRPDTVAISVDSLERFMNPPRTQTVCKVVKTADCAATLAGFVEDGRVGFRAKALAQSACAADGDVFAKADRFSQLALPALRKIWLRDKSALRVVESGDKVFLDAVFAGRTASGIGLAVTRFGETAAGGIGIVETRRKPDGRRTSFVYALGESQAATAYFREHPDTAKLPPVEFVKTMMGVALAAAASESQPAVGPPAAVIQFSSGGVRWEETGACEAP